MFWVVVHGVMAQIYCQVRFLDPTSRVHAWPRLAPRWRKYPRLLYLICTALSTPSLRAPTNSEAPPNCPPHLPVVVPPAAYYAQIAGAHAPLAGLWAIRRACACTYMGRGAAGAPEACSQGRATTVRKPSIYRRTKDRADVEN